MDARGCPAGIARVGPFVGSGAGLRVKHAALIALVLIAGCAPSRISQDQAPEGTPVDARVDALRLRIDAFAAPWPEASSALSLMRDSGEARALTPREVRQLVDGADERWEVVYGLDPSAVRTEVDQADAAILRVTEWISRGADQIDDATSVEPPGRVVRPSVVRRFRLEGLASGRTVIVDVPLRGASGAGRREGERWQASVNGAPIEAPLGASHVPIELARDEATVIRVGPRAP
jgi:hypothetical protein